MNSNELFTRVDAAIAEITSDIAELDAKDIAGLRGQVGESSSGTDRSARTRKIALIIVDMVENDIHKQDHGLGAGKA